MPKEKVMIPELEEVCENRKDRYVEASKLTYQYSLRYYEIKRIARECNSFKMMRRQSLVDYAKFDTYIASFFREEDEQVKRIEEMNDPNIIYTNHILSIKEDEIDGMEEYQAYSEIIRENIEYDALCERHPYEKEIVDGIVDLILETVISKKDSVLMSGQEYPAALVKAKFLKLNYSHIEYVIGCMGKNTTKVRNIKGYLMAALFNAGSTMGSYYKAEVNYDMPQFAG